MILFRYTLFLSYHRFISGSFFLLKTYLIYLAPYQSQLTFLVCFSWVYLNSSLHQFFLDSSEVLTALSTSWSLLLLSLPLSLIHSGAEQCGFLCHKCHGFGLRSRYQDALGRGSHQYLWASVSLFESWGWNILVRSWQATPNGLKLSQPHSRHQCPLLCSPFISAGFPETLPHPAPPPHSSFVDSVLLALIAPWLLYYALHS